MELYGKALETSQKNWYPNPTWHNKPIKKCVVISNLLFNYQLQFLTSRKTTHCIKIAIGKWQRYTYTCVIVLTRLVKFFPQYQRIFKSRELLSKTLERKLMTLTALLYHRCLRFWDSSWLQESLFGEQC